MPATSSVSAKRTMSKKAKRFQKKYFPKTESIRSIVRKEILNIAEKKEANLVQGIGDLYNVSNTANFGSNTIALTPYTGILGIGQGAAQNQRVGNKIKITKALIKMMIVPKPYDATSNSVPTPQVVNVFIWSPKGVSRDITDARFIAANSFFNNGASVYGLTGNMRDYLYTINDDTVVLHARYTIKVGSQSYSLNTGAQDNAFNYTNNDFKMCAIKTIDYTKFLASQYTFNDISQTPNEPPIYMTISPVDFDGGANADTTNAIPLQWEFFMKTKYTDV